MLQLPADQMLKEAQRALSESRHGFAEQACRSVLKVAPKQAAAWITLARVLTATGRLPEAEECLEKAAQFGADPVALTSAKASLLWMQGRDSDAIKACEIVLASRPNDLDAKVLTASCKRRLGDIKAAIRLAEELPASPDAAWVAANAHLDSGAPESAVGLLTPFVARTDLHPISRARIFHVLGLAQEALGRYDEALRSYQASKQAVPGRFNADAFRSGIKLVREVFTADFLRDCPKATVRTSRPVFIAAMPRSGTTLVDRIIAAHPKGGGAGETRALRAQIAEWEGPDQSKSFPRVVPSLTTADLDRMAGRYLAETNQYGAKALRIADKHLQNWVYVGLLAMIFPDARVIHLRRDPLDAGISALERLLGPAIPWSSDLRTIGLALRGADVLMDHWKAVAPIPILTVEYESLVRNQREETARILDFVGLPWDDACIAFHKEHKPITERPPPTLATEQTRKPMSDKAIGRGARFGAGLDPLREALAEPFEG